jgi:hypothetical protein
LSRLNKDLGLWLSRNLPNDLGLDGVDELVLRPHRDHEGPWPTNDAVLEIKIKVFNVPGTSWAASA